MCVCRCCVRARWVCLQTHKHVHARTHARTRKHTGTQNYLRHARPQIYSNMHPPVPADTHAHTDECVCIYTCVCANMLTYIHETRSVPGTYCVASPPLSAAAEPTAGQSRQNPNCPRFPLFCAWDPGLRRLPPCVHAQRHVHTRE